MAVWCSRPPLPVYLSCCSSPPLICHFLLLNPSSQFAPSRMDDVWPACVCRCVPLGPVGFSLSSLHLLYLKFQGGIKLFRPETRLHLSSFISLQTLVFLTAHDWTVIIFASTRRKGNLGNISLNLISFVKKTFLSAFLSLDVAFELKTASIWQGQQH